MRATGKRIAIVGGGLLGLATGYKLLSKYPGLRIDLFEKESGPATHQSGRNSGVLHCGLYYQPGSLKAKLAVEGIREMTAFCRAHGISHEICGKVVVATHEGQIEPLRQLASRGHQNGLQGLEFLSRESLRKREPHVKAVEALLVPEEGIVDFVSVARKLAELIQERGARIHFNTKVEAVISRPDGAIEIRTPACEGCYDRIVNCAGLFSDRLFKGFTRSSCPIRIVPFRGEYLMLGNGFSDLVKHLIYPVPDSQFPFLGVHFTRLISGEREVGPNAVLAFKREGYSIRDFSLADTMDILLYRGLWRFLRKNTRFALGELWSSLSIQAFMNKAKALVPEIDVSMLVKGTAGVRAQALAAEGDLIMDFRIERIGSQIHVLNTPSPGATASLAIAEYILHKYLNDLG